MKKLCIWIFYLPSDIVAELPLFWAAPAPDGKGPEANSGSSSDLLGSAPAPVKKRQLKAAPAPDTKIFQFKLSKSELLL